MTRMIGFTGIIFLGVIAWRIVDGMSSDAISMGIGVVFGILAGIPMALLTMVATRRRAEQRPERSASYGVSHPYYQHQPPVIVVTGGAPHQSGPAWGPPQGNYDALPGPAWESAPNERSYRIVGAPEE